MINPKIPDFETEVECVEAWGHAVYQGALLRVTLAEAKALPAQPCTLIPAKATAEEYAALLLEFRRFFDLPGEEPKPISVTRRKLERTARALAKKMILKGGIA